MIKIELFIVQNNIEHRFEEIKYKDEEISFKYDIGWFLCYPNELGKYINLSFEQQYRSDEIDNRTGYCCIESIDSFLGESDEDYVSLDELEF